MRLHELIRSWLGSETPDAAELYSRLSMHGRTGCICRTFTPGAGCPGNLAQAGRAKDIEKILWNTRWINAKLHETNIHALVTDFDHLKPQPDAKLIQDTLRLSAHVLSRDPNQFASHMVGRLMLVQETPSIKRFVATMGRARQDGGSRHFVRPCTRLALP